MKNSLFKKITVSLLLIAVWLIAYNLLFFLVPFNRELSNGSYWITYGLTHFALLSNLVIVFIGIGNKKLDSRVFGFPIVRVGIIFAIIQIVIDIFIMSVGNWISIPYWITLIIEILLVAIVLTSLIIKTAYKDTIIKVSDTKDSDEFMRNLRIELEQLLLSQQSNQEINQDLFRLLENAKYTISISKECVFDIEEDILENVGNLRYSITKNDFEKSKNIIAVINALLKERKERLSI